MPKPNSSSVYILVYNDKGKLLLQIRSKNDESYPLHYDFSAAGGIEENETKEDAVKRELMEELGIESELTYLGEDEHNEEKMYIYKSHYSGDFNIGPEVESIKFHSIDEIQNMMKNSEDFHPEFQYFFQKHLKNRIQ